VTLLRIRACSDEELHTEVIVVELPKQDRRPREALVLRGSDGAPRAYLNRCRHLPIPIDAGSREFLTVDRQHLLCGTHGALYQLDDGRCVAGPCLHLVLESIPLEREGDTWFLVVAG
jgi:nitrite reductase/ring-hydroxylating ferredoxin subunit